MSKQIRIRPIPAKASDASVLDFFKKNISFSKLERLKSLKVVILSFNDKSDLEKALEKLPTLKWEKQPLEISVIGVDQKTKPAQETMPDAVEIAKLPYFLGTTADLAGMIKHASDALFRRDDTGQNLMHWISRNSYYSDEQPEMLLKCGFKIDEKDFEGRTPLHHAYNQSFAKWLIAAGADVNSKDKIGKTPLHYAAAKGYLDICKVLAEHGADINTKANDNATPWDVRFKNLDFEKQLHFLGARSGQGETKLTQTKAPDWDWFWGFFSTNPESPTSVRMETLSKKLEAISSEQIGEFSHHLFHLVREGYQRSICGFSIAIQGPTDDDGFEDFIYWIISKGRDFYEQAFKNADKLAAANLDWKEFDQFVMKDVIKRKYAEKTDEDFDSIEVEMIPCSTKFDFISKAKGEDFEWSEEQLQKKFPNLVNRFGK